LTKPDQKTDQQLGHLGSSVQIAQAVPTMVSLVTSELRSADLIEIEAFFGSLDQIDQKLTKIVLASGPTAWAALVNSEPALIFGVFVCPDTPHLGVAWGFGTDQAWRTIPQVSRFIRRLVVPAFLAAGVRRVEVRVLADNKSSVSWLRKSMGATLEAELADHGVAGQTFLQFAWTKKQFLPKAI
jgi:hypothetical protein